MSNTSTLCAASLGGYSPGGPAVSVCAGGGCGAGSNYVSADHGRGGTFCGGARCGVGQVCINDGSERCSDACLRERSLARECASRSDPVPWAVVPVVGVPLADRLDAQRHGCRLWAQTFAPAGTHALASTDPAVGDGSYCGMGDACNGAFPDANGTHPLCTCKSAVDSIRSVSSTTRPRSPTQAAWMPATWVRATVRPSASRIASRRAGPLRTELKGCELRGRRRACAVLFVGRDGERRRDGRSGPSTDDAGSRRRWLYMDWDDRRHE